MQTWGSIWACKNMTCMLPKESKANLAKKMQSDQSMNFDPIMLKSSNDSIEGNYLIHLHGKHVLKR